jgi:SAM-dependent methyltransferase
VSFDYHAVPGDYQYRALRSGHSMQRFWHGGKLVLIDHLIRPHLSSGSRFLEIGCGAGNLLLRAAVRGSYPVAVDLSMRSLTFVRDRLLEAAARDDGPTGFGLAQAVGERLPLATASFDCVLLSEVIEHLVAPQNAVSEAARVLKPGARLLVTTPNYRSLWPAMEWGVDQLKIAPKMAGAQHITRFNPDSLRTLLLEADLRIEYFGTVYGFSPFLAMVSVEWARRRLQRELDRRSSFGMILVAMGVKN